MSFPPFYIIGSGAASPSPKPHRRKGRSAKTPISYYSISGHRPISDSPGSSKHPQPTAWDTAAPSDWAKAQHRVHGLVEIQNPIFLAAAITILAPRCAFRHGLIAPILRADYFVCFSVYGVGYHRQAHGRIFSAAGSPCVPHDRSDRLAVHFFSCIRYL